MKDKIKYFAPYFILLILGLALPFDQPWIGASSPVIEYALLQRLPSQNNPLLKTYFFALAFYVGANILWLPSALREISGASWVPVFFLSSVFILWNSLSFVGLGLGNKFSQNRDTLRPLLSAALFTITSAGLPTLADAIVGDFLNGYSIFWSGAKIYGSIGLSFFFCLLCFSLIEIKNSKINVYQFGISAAALILPMVFGAHKIPKNDSSPSLNILAIQTNKQTEFLEELSQPKTSSKLRGSQIHADYVLQKISKLKNKSFDLIITPESGIGLTPANPWQKEMTRRWSEFHFVQLKETLRDLNSHYLGVFRSYNYLGTLGDQNQVPNRLETSLLIHPSGAILDRIPKGKLIPFVEYLPGAEQFPWLQKLFTWIPGTPERSYRQNFTLEEFKFSSLICYDSLFRDSYWRALDSHTDLTLILSNDGVIGRLGAFFHTLVGQSRATEYGLPTLLVGNVGFTGIIGKNLKANWNQFDTREFKIHKSSLQPTFYAKFIGRPLEAGVSYSFLFIVVFLIGLFIHNLVRQRQYNLLISILKNPVFLSVSSAVLVLSILLVFFIEVAFVPSPSMEPTLRVGDRVLLCKQPFPIKRGDIISFYDPQSKRLLLKRVFLLPGESYQFNSGKPQIDGNPITLKNSNSTDIFIESLGGYKIKSRDDAQVWPNYDIQMKDNEYFVLGDHRSNSSDSRFFGPISIRNIKGKICALF